MSFILRYRAGLSDEGIVGRDQVIASESSNAPCQLDLISEVDIRDPAEIKALKTVVNPMSPVFTLNAGAAPLMEHGKNVSLMLDAHGGSVRERALHFDEIWSCPGTDRRIQSNLTFRPETIIQSRGRTRDLPTQEEVALIHEGMVDLRGVQAALSGWCLADWTSDIPLMLSLHGLDHDLTKKLVSSTMDEFGRRDIFILREPSIALLDACMERCQLLICAHITPRGWRPMAMKAALAGRSVLTPRTGDTPWHLEGCAWVDISVDSQGRPCHVREAFQSALDCCIINEAIPKIKGSNTPGFIDAANARVRELTKEAGR